MTKSPIMNNYDKIIAMAMAFLSLILSFYLVFFASRPLYLITTASIFISSLVWLAIRNIPILYSSMPKYSPLNKILPILFFLLFTFSIFSIHWSQLYLRPISYFILISSMTVIVFYEILYTKSSLILFQICIIGVSLAFTEAYLFTGVIGVDPWWHQMFTLRLLSLHSIPEDMLYSRMPLFHTEIALTSMITGFNYKNASLFSITLFQIIWDILFLFSLGSITFNKNIGLLASLFVTVSNFHIDRGFAPVPTTMGICFVTLILYMLFREKKESRIEYNIIIFLVMGILILTHSLSSAILAVLLFIGYFSRIIYNIIFKENLFVSIPLKIPILFLISMFSWWIYSSGHFTELAEMIKWGFNADFFSGSIPSEVLEYSSEINIWEKLLANIGACVFFGLSFVGFFYMISLKCINKNAFVIAILSITPLTLAFFSLITGHSIIEGRWFYIAQILTSLLLSVTTLLMFGKKSIANITIFGIFVFILTFFMITSPIANIDNREFYPDSGVRYAFTDSEIIGASFFVTHYSGIIASDYDFAVNPSSSILINLYNIPYTRIRSIDESLYSSYFIKNSYIKLIRSEITKNPFRLSSGIFKLNYNITEPLDKSGHSRIYDNQGISAYI